MPLPDLVSWTFEDDFVTAGANARIALALLRCARRYPHSWHPAAVDELAWHLRPARQHCEAALQRALVESHVRERLDVQRVDASPSGLLDTRKGRAFLGNALLAEDPSFTDVFDEAIQCFAEFVTRQPHPVAHNVRLITDVFALSDVEARYLTLAGSFCFSTIKQSAFVPIRARSRFAHVLSALLECSGREAADLMDMNRSLWRSGLLMRSDFGDVPEGVDELFHLSAFGARLMALTGVDEGALAAAVLEPLGPPGEWTWPHLEDTQRLLCAVLSNAASRKGAGVHILILGEPGSGQMAFVKAVLGLAGLHGYRVPALSRLAPEPSRGEQLADLALSRRFASRQPGAVLVVEDAEAFLAVQAFEPSSKGWMSEVLKEPGQPVIWIADDARHIDPSYLARFTCCVALRDPPLGVRRLWCRSALTEQGCSDPAIESFADSPLATSGLIEGARRCVSLCAGGGVDSDVALQAFLKGHASSIEGNTTDRRRHGPAHGFDLQFTHIAESIDVPYVVRSLAADGEGTVLLAGASGVGKTSLAVAMARQLERDVVRAAASDFLSPYRGEAGRRLLRWLGRHDTRDTLLLLDDLGAFANDSDEDSLVGALQYGIDRFGGVLVATASAAADLPPALIRRLTYRLTLLPLTLPQRCALFTRLVSEETGREMPLEVQRALVELDRLTPGDFFNVRARLRHRHADWRRWLAELALEHEAKRLACKTMSGFGVQDLSS